MCHGVDTYLGNHPRIIGWLVTAFPVVVVGSRKVESIEHLVNRANRVVIGQPFLEAWRQKELLIRLTRPEMSPEMSPSCWLALTPSRKTLSGMRPVHTDG